MSVYIPENLCQFLTHPSYTFYDTIFYLSFSQSSCQQPSLHHFSLPRYVIPNLSLCPHFCLSLSFLCPYLFSVSLSITVSPCLFVSLSPIISLSSVFSIFSLCLLSASHSHSFIISLSLSVSLSIYIYHIYISYIPLAYHARSAVHSWWMQTLSVVPCRPGTFSCDLRVHPPGAPSSLTLAATRHSASGRLQHRKITYIIVHTRC